MSATDRSELDHANASNSCTSHDQQAAAGYSEAANEVMATTYEVSGMTCGHCVASVTEEIGRLADVERVDVELIVGGLSRVAVSGTKQLEDTAVAAAVDEAGYELAGRAR